jgi:cell division septum initiation protein DivIVA
LEDQNEDLTQEIEELKETLEEVTEERDELNDSVDDLTAEKDELADEGNIHCCPRKILPKLPCNCICLAQLRT